MPKVGLAAHGGQQLRGAGEEDGEGGEENEVEKEVGRKMGKEVRMKVEMEMGKEWEFPRAISCSKYSWIDFVEHN